MVMEPPEFGYCDHLPALGTLDRPWLWTIHRQGQRRPPRMIRGKVMRQDTREMARVEDVHMVQALAADTPNQPLHRGMLPRTPRGDDDFLEAHVPHPLPKGRT